jgi:hypothetical protein
VRVFEHRTVAYQAHYGPTVGYDQEVAHCDTCGESSDARGVNARVARAAIDRADRASVPLMLDALAAVGHSPGYLEREHGLPAGTLARWRRGDCSPEGLALLRLLRAGVAEELEALGVVLEAVRDGARADARADAREGGGR